MCFNPTSEEIISSHMFRASRAVDTVYKKNLIKAKHLLNHAHIQTTFSHYLLPERRGILENMEEDFEKNLKNKNNGNSLGDIKEEKMSLPEEELIQNSYKSDSDSISLDSDYYDEDEDCQQNNIVDNNINNLEKAIKTQFNKSSVCDDNLNDESNQRKYIASNELKKFDDLFRRNNKASFYIKFELNKQIDSKSDDVNSKVFFEILEKKRKNFNDSNLLSKDDIDNFKYSRIKDQYYKLCGKNLEIYKQTLQLSSIGIYPNMLVRKVSEEIGFGVFATRSIKSNPLLMRYAGLIQYFKDIENNRDDLMTLFPTKNQSFDRIINPETFCNMARFMNHSNSKTKYVASVAVINESSKVDILFYAIKNI